MKLRLALLGLAMLWLGASAASAAEPIDCEAPTSPTRSTLCAHPTLVDLDRELIALITQHAAANQKRPRRIQGLARQMDRDLLDAREGTYPFDGVMERLKLIHAARAWRDKAVASVAEPNAETYHKAIALGAEAEARLDVLMPGDLARFNAALMTARRASAPLFAWAKLESVSSKRHDAAMLAALARARAELEPAFADMNAADREAITAKTRAIEDRILTTAMVREVDAIESFGSGLAAMEAGRQWHVRYLVDYGRYEARPMVAQMLAAFRKRRASDAAAVAGELAAMIAATETAGAFETLSERYLVVAFDRENPRIGAAIAEREATFARQDLLADAKGGVACGLAEMGDVGGC